MHRKLLAAALASAAMFVVGGAAQAADTLGRVAMPAPAFPTISGEAEIFVGAGSNDSGDSFGYLGGAARATFWLAPTFSSQIDLNLAQWHWDDTSSANIGSVVGHLNFRNQNFLLGVYGGLAYLYEAYNVRMFGGEGQIYLGDFTLEARAGWAGQAEGGYGSGADFRAAARYFIDPNTMFEINGGFQSLKYDTHTWSIGAVAEHKFGTNPISIFAAVDYGHSNFKGGWSATVGRIGAKVLFGQPTLRSADQTGSSLGKGFDFQLRQAF